MSRVRSVVHGSNGLCLGLVLGLGLWYMGLIVWVHGSNGLCLGLMLGLGLGAWV